MAVRVLARLWLRAPSRSRVAILSRSARTSWWKLGLLMSLSMLLMTLFRSSPTSERMSPALTPWLTEERRRSRTCWGSTGAGAFVVAGGGGGLRVLVGAALVGAAVVLVGLGDGGA